MRLSWVDNSKAIGIVLVVTGHTVGLGEPVYKYIYSFHIPLFFFLSGFLLKQKHLKTEFFTFAKEKFKVLIIPYLSFWVISYLYWLPTHSMRGQSSTYSDLSLYAPFIGLLYGINETLYPNVVLWFFTALYITM